jgi:hypothetical protein
MSLDKVNHKWRVMAEVAFVACFKRLLGTRLEQLQKAAEKVFKLPVPCPRLELSVSLYRRSGCVAARGGDTGLEINMLRIFVNICSYIGVPVGQCTLLRHENSLII